MELKRWRAVFGGNKAEFASRSTFTTNFHQPANIASRVFLAPPNPSPQMKNKVVDTKPRPPLVCLPSYSSDASIATAAPPAKIGVSDKALKGQASKKKRAPAAKKNSKASRPPTAEETSLPPTSFRCDR